MSDGAKPAEPAEPWRSFLTQLDMKLMAPVELHCLGGFVVTQHYGVAERETSDIDFLVARIRSGSVDLEALAGMHSPLYHRFRIYLQRVTVVTPMMPEISVSSLSRWSSASLSTAPAAVLCLTLSL